MRIGLSSVVGDGFGTGAFSFGEVPSGGGGIPPEGTILSTLYGVTYPISEGGSYVTTPLSPSDYENQDCDVNVVADGLGGSYTDWTSVTNIVYKTSYIGNDGTAGSETISTPVGLFTTGTWTSTDFSHDGTGGYTTYRVNLVEAQANDLIGNDGTSGYSELEVPASSGVFFTYGTFSSIDYYYDGMGSYYSSPDWVTFVSDGDYITNYGGIDYYWSVSGTTVGYRTYP